MVRTDGNLEPRVWFRRGNSTFEIVRAERYSSSSLAGRYVGLKDGRALVTGDEKAAVMATLVKSKDRLCVPFQRPMAAGAAADYLGRLGARSAG